jgi:hypothetical protein
LAAQGITPESHLSYDEETLAQIMDSYELDEESIKEDFRYDPRASDEDIARVEQALGASLPSDYVQFLKEFGGPTFEARRWERFYTAKWDKNGNCDLVGQFPEENPEQKGRFVAIAESGEEADAGFYGFAVEDGVCQRTVRFFDTGSNRVYFGANDVLEFLLQYFYEEDNPFSEADADADDYDDDDDD